jgi:NAD-dependent deacetylase
MSTDRLFVLTGAGVSAESGIPTFRGVNGLWRNYRIEEVASPDAWRRDPRLVWEFYSMRRRVRAYASRRTCPSTMLSSVYGSSDKSVC